MAKEKNDGSYLWCTELWHKRLLQCNDDEKENDQKSILLKLVSTNT